MVLYYSYRSEIQQKVNMVGDHNNYIGPVYLLYSLHCNNIQHFISVSILFNEEGNIRQGLLNMIFLEKPLVLWALFLAKDGNFLLHL